MPKKCLYKCLACSVKEMFYSEIYRERKTFKSKYILLLKEKKYSDVNLTITNLYNIK